ncbi:DUF5723 family protein [Candidatus Cloacimonadota bacterium]
MKKLILISLISFISLLVADTVDNPVSISLGDAFMLRSNDYRALGWNPAQLSHYSKKVTLGLGNMNILISNNALSLSFYNDLMGANLNESKKKEFLDRIPDSGLGLDADVGGTSPLLALSYKNFAFRTTFNVVTTSSFSKELFEFIIDDLEFRSYDFSDSRGEIASVMEYQFGYGHKISLNEYLPYDFPPVYAGLSIGYILGMNYARISKIKSKFVNSTDGMVLDNYVKIKTSGVEIDEETDDIKTDVGNMFNGHGFRMDLGFVADVSEQLTLGLNFKNMLGVIVWKNACEEHVFSAYGDSLFIYMEDEDFDEAVVDTDTTYSIDKITQNIPFEIHLGAAYKLNKFDLYADFVQGFDTSVYTSSNPKFSLGAEYDILRWLPLRVGFGFGEERSSHFSIGSGLVFRKFELNWATRSYYSPLPTFSKGMSFSLGMILKFD